MSDTIVVVPYDENWPARFEQEKCRLHAALPAGLAVEFIHFGSTSVPGLSAKPVIDMIVVVTSLERAKLEFAAMLAPLEYILWTTNPKKDRLLFVKGMPPYGTQRTHHVHVFQSGNDEIEKRVRFRNRLASNARLRKDYETLKLALAKQFSTDRDGYTEAKKEFILNALEAY